MAAGTMLLSIGNQRSATVMLSWEQRRLPFKGAHSWLTLARANKTRLFHDLAEETPHGPTQRDTAANRRPTWVFRYFLALGGPRVRLWHDFATDWLEIRWSVVRWSPRKSTVVKGEGKNEPEHYR